MVDTSWLRLPSVSQLKHKASSPSLSLCPATCRLMCLYVCLHYCYCFHCHHLPVYHPQVVSSAIVDKYIGESARIIREMFGYAREHQPCVIFMDEVDAIGGEKAKAFLLV